MEEKLITVFTPTFNRAEMLPILYESLTRQTSKNFKWLIVDDNSKDNTYEVIDRIRKKEISFEIEYIKNTSSEHGVHRAMNIAINIVTTSFFMKVDDDDYLTDDAIESVESWINGLPQERIGEFAGVSGLRAYHDGRINGGTPKMNGREYVDATSFERKKYNLGRDKAEVYFTDILKRYGPFPEIPGENHISEGLLWNRIANAGLKIRWYNKIIYYTEYLPDGLTMNAEERCEKDFKSFQIMTKEYVSYSQVDFIDKTKSLRRYFRIARKKGYKTGEMLKEFQSVSLIIRLVAMVTSYLDRPPFIKSE